MRCWCESNRRYERKAFEAYNHGRRFQISQERTDEKDLAGSRRGALLFCWQANSLPQRKMKRDHRKDEFESRRHGAGFYAARERLEAGEIE